MTEATNANVLNKIGEDPAAAQALFEATFRRDHERRLTSDWKESWVFIKRSLMQGTFRELNFEKFLGAEHLSLLYGWIDKHRYPNFLDQASIRHLVETSAERDRVALLAAGLDRDPSGIGRVALYNAQDYYFQTFLPVPERQKVRTILDFGAGHGRQANLWFANQGPLQSFIAVDITPAFYLTQIYYYRLLGLAVEDYLVKGDAWQVGAQPDTVHHLPFWRLDLIADQSVDMVCAVQVLRELSKPVLVAALTQFRRLLKPGGAIYIRDHIGWHNVNQVDLDRLLTTFGFVLEWQPNVVDRVDVHGVPRVWRLAEVDALVGGL